MIPNQEQTTFPIFANNGTKLQPDATKYANGYLEGDVIPYQWENWFLNTASEAITKNNAGLKSIEAELNNILANVGVTPNANNDTQILNGIITLITNRITKNLQITDADGSNAGASVSFTTQGTVVLKLPSTIKAQIEGGITTAEDSAKFGGNTPAQFRSLLSGVQVITATTTVVPEYDRRYVINADNISFTLAAGTTPGTKVAIYTNYNTSIVYGNITDNVGANRMFEYMWTGQKWTCTSAPNVGAKEWQMPDDDEPAFIYGGQWQEKKYGGAFFRAVGGDAKDFTPAYSASDNGSRTLTFNGENKPYLASAAGHAKDGIAVGDAIFSGGEYRTVTAITPSDDRAGNVTLDSSFSGYATLTNVLIGQMDQFQGHWHKLGNENGINTVALGAATLGGDVQGANPGDLNRYSVDLALDAISDGTNGTPRYGEETRVKNISIKLWQRIS